MKNSKSKIFGFSADSVLKSSTENNFLLNSQKKEIYRIFWKIILFNAALRK